MTGYGRAEAILETGKLTIEIRSLNGKTADISIKSQLLPKDKELAIRQKIADSLVRGNIDVFLTYEANSEDSAKTINKDIVLSYWQQLTEINSEIDSVPYGTADADHLLPAILRLPDVFETKKQDIITEENWLIVDKAFDEALEDINRFRSREGEVLYKDVTDKVKRIQGYSAEVETYEKERTETIREKILGRFAELKLEPDQSRLEQEMIFYIEKLDINEEKVRLRQHCKYFIETIDTDPFPGKKLGFIAQEMGREINTTGSKANHNEIQKLVVKMKDELEKIKEQSLNIL